MPYVMMLYSATPTNSVLHIRLGRWLPCHQVLNVADPKPWP